MTKPERRLMDEYTVARGAKPGAMTVSLVIGNQSFCVARSLNRPQVRFYRKMLAVALERFLVKHGGTP